MGVFLIVFVDACWDLAFRWLVVVFVGGVGFGFCVLWFDCW